MINLILSLAILSSQSAAPLTATDPIVVPGGPGKFDFMNLDPVNRLVLACHPGKSSFAVVDLRTGTARSVDAGFECNGIGFDSAGKKVYAAGPGQTLVCFDSTTWKRIGTLSLGGRSVDLSTSITMTAPICGSSIPRR